MVTSVTNYGRSGVYDHLIQRTSAVIVAIYTLFLFGFVVATPELQFAQWQGLFAQTWMKIFTLAALVSTCAHAWVGMWTISTDYMKSAFLRFVFQLVCVSALFVYLVWGTTIVWGV